ncbi:DUF563 domain-containing [Brachionus plicatilis]|uniref:DUF563 domain-containing n=1 Tax=Brachionus plicatilis TaxID=10195 RepID=A0A3M7PEW4_BRAPC|nr:DUF563 domain-containing [Brachionus plicatilis]
MYKKNTRFYRLLRCSNIKIKKKEEFDLIICIPEKRICTQNPKMHMGLLYLFFIMCLAILMKEIHSMCYSVMCSLGIECFDKTRECVNLLFSKNPFLLRDDVNFHSELVECNDYSDLTTFCLYKNICNVFFVTNSIHKQKIILNETVPILFFPIMADLNFLLTNSPYFDEPFKWNKGCHSYIGFNFPYSNIYHWAKKLIILFQFKNSPNENRFCDDFQTIQIFSKKKENLGDWQTKFFELTLSMSKEKIIKHDSKSNLMQCFDYLFVPGTANYLFRSPKEAIIFRNQISSKKDINFERKKIIFLKRKKNRFIVNQKELDDFISSKFIKEDLSFVSTENLNFDQQVLLFSKAKLLISIHGAGLTNVIFMPSSSVVLEIFPPNFFNEIEYKQWSNLFSFYSRQTSRLLY